jgi:RNA polymerase sigma-70 factor (ECF subfamily)
MPVLAGTAAPSVDPLIGTLDAEVLPLLVARAKAGDRDAYTVLYHRHVHEVYRFALLRLADREAAEDATQTVFMRALAALPTCRENEAFVGWLFAIARSVIANHLRARRVQADPLPENADWVTSDPSPDEVAQQSEAMGLLLAARERCLSARDRELFDLLLMEHTHREIAAALGRSRGAVRTAHWRLLSKLRACLGAPSTYPRKGQDHV